MHVLLDGTHVRGSPMPVSVHRDVDALARGALTGKLSTAVTGLRRGLTTARRMQNQLRSEAEGLQQYVPVLVQVRPHLTTPCLPVCLLPLRLLTLLSSGASGLQHLCSQQRRGRSCVVAAA